MTQSFADRIAGMNKMYGLPVHAAPHLPARAIIRIADFADILEEEVLESTAIPYKCDPLDTLTAIADWLGDITVYCRSEALRFGIPLEDVLNIIMDSNESKLGADGKPIHDERGKFLKGPHYWKPEPKIRELLAARMAAKPAEKSTGTAESA